MRDATGVRRGKTLLVRLSPCAVVDVNGRVWGGQLQLLQIWKINICMLDFFGYE